MSDQDDYEIGYGKPPAGFPKGVSGNPAGRPKKARDSKAAIQAALNEQVTIQENGEHKTMSMREAVAKIMVRHALKGDVRALIKVLDTKFTGDVPDDANQPLGLSRTDQEIVQGLVDRLRKVLLAETPAAPHHEIPTAETPADAKQGGDDDQSKS